MTAISLPMLLLTGLLSAALVEGSPVELRYQGTFAKVSRDRETVGDPVKRFDLYCLVTPRNEQERELVFFVDEHGAGAWPWPARFGKIATGSDNRPTKNRIRLLHEHEGTEYVLLLPFPYFEFSNRLVADAHWEAPRAVELPNQRDVAPWHFKVAGTTKIGSRNCWRVDVSNNFGAQESLWIEKGTSLLVKAERRVVIGRGDEHLLKMTLDSVTPVPAEKLTQLQKPLEGLLRLQEELKRSDEDKSPELNDSQLKTAANSIKTVEATAEGTPFEPLVAAIVRDINTQSRRSGDVGNLATRFVGKKAPQLSLKLLDDEVVPADQLTGKVILLHFWSYRGEPFPPEPYGQVGFLDFLYNRRKNRGLQVYGIAVDRGSNGAAQVAAVIRSVRKLQGFMNLSYPLALDDGSLLEKFGDPERTGAKLPLWVLIDSKGIVTQYKVGNYDVKGNDGLSQLDKAVMSLLRKKQPAK